MVWNQAAALREWIMYHAWLGVGRWFIYDNNSYDDIEEVVRELNLENYNISRLTWPWIKTQEAGFSHCALRARDECKWVGFFDVDEFFYFPSKYRRQQEYHTAGRNALHSLIANSSASTSNSTTIAEIRTACHSFGPSGLTSYPPQGVTLGYTCRLQSPERHKSFVRPDLLDPTLLNVVHHFRLKRGSGFFDVPKSNAMLLTGRRHRMKDRRIEHLGLGQRQSNHPIGGYSSVKFGTPDCETLSRLCSLIL